jgi:hypothetical protein
MIGQDRRRYCWCVLNLHGPVLPPTSEMPLLEYRDGRRGKFLTPRRSFFWRWAYRRPAEGRLKSAGLYGSNYFHRGPVSRNGNLRGRPALVGQIVGMTAAMSKFVWPNKRVTRKPRPPLWAAAIRDTPDRAVSVLADEKSAVMRHRYADGACPHRGLVHDEPGHEVLIFAGWHPIL